MAGAQPYVLQVRVYARPVFWFALLPNPIPKRFLTALTARMWCRQ